MIEFDCIPPTIVPKVGSEHTLEHKYHAALFAYRRFITSPVCHSRYNFQVAQRSINVLTDTLENIYDIMPFEERGPVTKINRQRSGISVLGNYMMRHFPHPSDSSLDTEELEPMPKTIDLLYVGVEPSSVVLHDEDGERDSTPPFEDIFIVGHDMNDLMPSGYIRPPILVPFYGIEISRLPARV